MSKLGSFVWSIADQLRGAYKPHQYGDVILPMTILRRLDCILEPTRDEVRELAGKEPNPVSLERKIRQKYGLHFHNTSNFSLGNLTQDPDNLRSNLIDYISRFSADVDVFERFEFENQITKMDEKNRLFQVVSQFGEIDLHPDTLSNADMGDLFEELIRKFAENSNEQAGEHFTPRDAIRLMVDLLFAEDNSALLEPGVVRSVYDPTVGTGGMLTVAEDRLRELNPESRVTMYGQEINDQSYAICKSDMIAKGQDVTNIRLGDTLAEDLFAGRTFDYCMSNPPYGVDWKASSESVKAERQQMGAASRFAAGLPKVSDGQMLFLQHLASKMRTAKDGGGRAGIVLNGSPLFNGRAGSGESEIRRYLLEHDLVEAIVALPSGMFYNTGISTYIWILDNSKAKERVGKVQLIDGAAFYTKMRKNLGDKSREVSDDDREKIVKLYSDFEENEHSKIFSTSEFGFWTITVERPLRLNFSCQAERVDVALEAKPLAKFDHEKARSALSKLGDRLYRNRDEFLDDLRSALKAEGLKLPPPALKALWMGLSERDETADVCTDSKGRPEADTSLRDTENVPFGPNGLELGDNTIRGHFEREVEPHVPDAWIDQSKTRVGYEIPYARHFYRYVPPRPLGEIDLELNKLTAEIIALLQRIEE